MLVMMERLIRCAEGKAAHLRDRLTLRFVAEYTAALPITQ
jgi:hypothetical protein